MAENDHKSWLAELDPSGYWMHYLERSRPGRISVYRPKRTKRTLTRRVYRSPLESFLSLHAITVAITSTVPGARKLPKDFAFLRFRFHSTHFPSRPPLILRRPAPPRHAIPRSSVAVAARSGPQPWRSTSSPLQTLAASPPQVAPGSDQRPRGRLLRFAPPPLLLRGRGGGGWASRWLWPVGRRTRSPRRWRGG